MSVETLRGVARPPASPDREGRLVLETRSRVEFVDLTDEVVDRVARSGVERGLVLIHSRHTTAGIVVNENEPRLLEDYRRRLESWAPGSDRYHHDDLHLRPDAPVGERPNGVAHARALLLGCSRTLAVVDGAPVLGRWQRILFVELDGPRRRGVLVHVLGEPAGGGRR
jgi:secondary thiamine-phosphate synthase enzyme